jgi:transcriptional regulator with XRE-family HTH domain
MMQCIQKCPYCPRMFGEGGLGAHIHHKHPEVSPAERKTIYRKKQSDHSIIQEVVRRMPAPLCKPSQSVRIVHAVRKGGRCKREIEQVPVKSIPAKSLTLNLGGDCAGSEPSGDAREVLRCPKCTMNQFLTASGKCRKCRAPLKPEQRIEAFAKPPEPTGDRQTRTIDIGFAVNFLRNVHNISQAKLAARMRVPRTWISKLENLGIEPTMDSIERLSAGLEVSALALVTIAEAAGRDNTRCTRFKVPTPRKYKACAPKPTQPETREALPTFSVNLSRSYSHIYQQA